MTRPGSAQVQPDGPIVPETLIYVGVFDLAADDGKGINEREVVREIMRQHPNAMFVGLEPSAPIRGLPLDRIISHRAGRGLLGELVLQVWLVGVLFGLLRGKKGRAVMISRPHFISLAPLIVRLITGVHMIGKEAGIANWFKPGHGRLPSLLRRPLVWLRKRNVLAADRLWCVNQTIANYWLTEAQLSKTRVFIQPNGVNTVTFSIDVAPEIPTVARPAEECEKLLLYAGNLFHSGVPVLVQAVAQLTRQGLSIGLIVAGDGEERAQIEEMARKEGIEGRIALPGWLPYHQMPGLYAGCDILTALFDREFLSEVGFRSQKLFQYLATGRAVLAGESPEHEFLEKQALGCIADPENPIEVAEVLAKMLGDPEMVQRAPQRAIWAVENASYVAVARNILAQAHGLLSEGD